jgi:prephenate dehydrogenase
VAQVTIIGLGTLGASLGLALRKADSSLTVVGVDRNAEIARRAQQAGAVERTERWAENACKAAALVVLTEPIAYLRAVLEAISAKLPQGCVVASTASLVTPVLAWAGELLPEGVSFVAGHPILDPAKPDDAPSPELFQQAQLCIVPSSKASQAAMDLMTQLAATVGAQPFFLDAAEHDGLVTAVDGMPELLGTALMSAALHASSWHDMRRVAGPTFARATASADVEPAEVAAALRANRENVARWLEIFSATLGDVRQALLSDDEDKLTELLAEAREARGRWLSDHRSGNWDNAEAPAIPKRGMLDGLLFPQAGPLAAGDKRRRR